MVVICWLDSPPGKPERERHRSRIISCLFSLCYFDFFSKPRGALTFRPETGFYKIDWSNTTRLESTLSVKNRSMELSELVRYEGRLFAFCVLARPKQLRIIIAQ